jgi:hypothetical protein
MEDSKNCSDNDELFLLASSKSIDIFHKLVENTGHKYNSHSVFLSAVLDNNYALVKFLIDNARKYSIDVYKKDIDVYKKDEKYNTHYNTYYEGLIYCIEISCHNAKIHPSYLFKLAFEKAYSNACMNIVELLCKEYYNFPQKERLNILFPNKTEQFINNTIDMIKSEFYTNLEKCIYFKITRCQTGHEFFNIICEKYHYISGSEIILDILFDEFTSYYHFHHVLKNTSNYSLALYLLNLAIGDKVEYDKKITYLVDELKIKDVIDSSDKQTQDILYNCLCLKNDIDTFEKLVSEDGKKYISDYFNPLSETTKLSTVEYCIKYLSKESLYYLYVNQSSYSREIYQFVQNYVLRYV